MRTLSTFSVLFWIYSKRAKNNLATIYARITINGRKLNISLKRKADVDLWDPKKQRVSGKSQNSKELNQFLDQEHSKLFQCYQELRVEGKVISPEKLWDLRVNSNYILVNQNNFTSNEYLLFNLNSRHRFKKSKFDLSFEITNLFNVGEYNLLSISQYQQISSTYQIRGRMIIGRLNWYF